jgi:hypothetical protein
MGVSNLFRLPQKWSFDELIPIVVDELIPIGVDELIPLDVSDLFSRPLYKADLYSNSLTKTDLLRFRGNFDWPNYCYSAIFSVCSVAWVCGRLFLSTPIFPLCMYM